ncbi:MAG: hypothetical protein ACRDE8_03305 [Ginsengibacter sp.]
MKRNIFTIVLIFYCGHLFAQDDIPTSSWVSTPVKVDGNAQEWKLPLRLYDDATKLFFGFANDDKNLYLCFQTSDEINEMKILRAGMKIYLSTKGKDKHKVSINFPMQQKAEPTTPSNEDTVQQAFERRSRRSASFTKDTMMEVKGFTTRNGIIPINDNSGINAAINRDDANKLTYEISIPLKELFGADYSTEDLSKDIFLDAEVNAMSKSGHTGNGGGGYSGRGGGGGRMGGGAGRLGGGGGGMHHNREGNEGANSEQTGTDRSAMFEKAELKQKFILAPNANSK